jgi:hypothetical protein
MDSLRRNVDSKNLTAGMNRNYKAWFERELECGELMDAEADAFWIAINPSTPKEQVQQASEKLYDLLRCRGVKVKD